MAGGEIVEASGEKSSWGNPSTHKDVRNEGRSGNVYENKGTADNLPETKDDICAWLEGILHKITRILQEPSAFLPLFERWRAIPRFKMGPR